MEQAKQDNNFDDGTNGLSPTKTFNAKAGEEENGRKNHGEADCKDTDDERCFGILVGIEAARSDMENRASKDGDDECSKNRDDDRVIAVATDVANEAYDVTTSKECDDGNR